MKIIIIYDVYTKEKVCIPGNMEEFEITEEDSSREPARKRWNELKDSGFAANMRFKIDTDETKHVVSARYAPSGTIYTFEVDFTVKKNQALEVDDLDRPGKHVYVVAADKDKNVKISELGFPVQKLRKAYKTK